MKSHSKKKTTMVGGEVSICYIWRRPFSVALDVIKKPPVSTEAGGRGK